MSMLKISALIYNFTCEFIKLPWQPSLRVSAKMAAKLGQGIKRRLKNLKTRNLYHLHPITSVFLL